MKYTWALSATLSAAMACSSSSSGPALVGSTEDAAAVEPAADASADASVDDADAKVDASKPTGQCAATFGSALNAGFGRIDGIVYAVQKPSDTSCVMPNKDHVVVQVLMKGAVYRLVANVLASGADTKIRVADISHALPAPAFTEGWHLNAPLDYVTTLGAHAGASFTALDLNGATATIASALVVGDPVSVYGTSGDGRPESAHLIHRNATNADGAIVVNPTTKPHFLLFHFSNQTF